jgi:hypothetical protein
MTLTDRCKQILSLIEAARWLSTANSLVASLVESRWTRAQRVRKLVEGGYVIMVQPNRMFDRVKAELKP